MAGNRLLYLTVLTFCGIFYIAYGQWLAWMVLITVLALPWFSLLLSLPAIFRFQAAPGGPPFLQHNGPTEQLWLLGSCPRPMPPFRGRLKLKRIFSGESWHYQNPEDLSTDHCGGITVTAEGVKVCDYLGLFSFPVRCRNSITILIRPSPLAMDPVPQIQQHIARNWVPKPGGGYAENHDLRLFRPGDSLNQIHWKLSSKTGSLILREPIEPQQGLILVTLNHRGTPEEIDRKLGRLLWLSNFLLEQELPFRLQVLTGEGIFTDSIDNLQQLQKAVDTLLCRKTAKEGDLRDLESTASWHCHIGGDPDEA